MIRQEMGVYISSTGSGREGRVVKTVYRFSVVNVIKLTDNNRTMAPVLDMRELVSSVNSFRSASCY
jgi:hypothetical protein